MSKVLNVCVDCKQPISRYSLRCQRCEGKNRFEDAGYRKNQSLKNKGQKRSEEARCKMGLAQKERFKDKRNHPKFGKIGLVGQKNGMYKDGRTSLIISLRHCREYDLWRTSIFERDRYVCQDCGQVGNKLEAHHIKEFSIIFDEFIANFSQFSILEDKETLFRLAMGYKEFWDVNNGKTVCENCHAFNYTTRP